MDSASGCKGVFLLDCPSEITSSILSYCSPTDHLCLSRVNKQLNAEANRLLYSIVQFLWIANADMPPVVPFLRTILVNPQLAGLVESLRLSGDGRLYTWNYRESLPKLSWSGAGSTLDLAVGLVADLQLPCTEDWVRGLQEGSMDAAVAFVLMQLPNLRSFVTTPNFTRDIRLQGAVLRTIFCGLEKVGNQERQLGSLPRFDRLQHIAAEFCCSNTFLRKPNTEALLSFFYLPAVKTLNLRLDNPARFSWPAATPPSPDTLTSLTLRNVRETSLKSILSATKRLVKLDWEFLYSEYNMSLDWEFLHSEYGPDFSLYPPIADLGCLVDALTPVRGTLKDLTIRANATEPHQMEYKALIEIRGSLKGLAEFNVERFQVPLPFLAGQLVPNNRFRISERLPRYIRTLVISNDLEEFNEIMMDQDDWDMDEITSNLLDWLCNDLGSTPFLGELDLGLLTVNEENSLYWAVRGKMEKERVPVILTVRGVSWTLNRKWHIDTMEALEK